MTKHSPLPASAGRRVVLGALALALGAPVVMAAQTRAAEPERASSLPQKFDPKRNAAADVGAAVSLASRTGKRVIVDVGGEWCSWCHIMDAFFASHPDLAALRERHYVWVKVNFSKDNLNTALLSRWPKIAGYPHLFVLDGRGELVHSQDTSPLESGKGYNADAVRAFLTRYAPPA